MRLFLGLINRARRSRGVTLTELMVAVALVSVGILVAMGSFKYIAQGIETTRLKTIATNLAQEEIEVLKNKPYYQLLVTTDATTSVGYNPNFVYDIGNYPPQPFTLWGGATFTRAVEVDYASVSGTSVSTVPYTSSDTGMKKVTVYVFWTERGIAKKVELDSYYENPSVATLDTGFKGLVTINGSATPIAGAQIQVIGTPKWRGTSDSGGNYSFSVAPGSYSLVCSSAGYFTMTSTQLAVVEGIYTQYSFPLTRIATGSVSSSSIYAANSSLVVSQVVASTVQPNGYDTQYIALFNGSNGQISVASVTPPASGAHSIQLNIMSSCGNHRECDDVQLVYVTTYVAAGKYYLIANTTTFVVGGVNYVADAYYTDAAGAGGTCAPTPPPGGDWNPPSTRNIIQANHNGAVWLTDSGGNTLDAVGWDHHVNPSPPQCETSCIKFNAIDPSGLLQGDQIVRFSSACAVGNAYGRSYDSDDNPNNFYYNNTGVAIGLTYQLFSSASGVKTVISGHPATSAHVFADDGNSAAVLSTNFSVSGPQGQSCPVSSFTIVNVATGTWEVDAFTGSSSQTITSVAVTQGVTTMISSATTVPTWPAAGFNHTVLIYPYTGGFASGHVYGAGPSYLTPIPGILMGSSQGNTIRTDSQGFYTMNLPTGTVTITANYNSYNPNYTTSDSVGTITQGVDTAMPDFHLAQGGFIQGYVTPGTGALPNIAVQATQGGAIYEDTTDNTGYFYIFVATSPSAYTVTPNLDPLQSYTSAPSNPLTATVTLPGSTVFCGTMTVVGALGTIKGSVTNSGASITTGVLVMASTGTISDPPPSIYGSSAPALNPIYSVSSLADGTYSLDVRSTTTAYNMRAFYPVVDIISGGVTYTSKTRSGVSVGAGAVVSGQDFTWP